MLKDHLYYVIALLFLFALTKPLSAQEKPHVSESYDRIAYPVSSGLHNGDAYANRSVQAFQTNISHQGAPWIRLFFESYDLGDNSYLMITSDADDSWQRLDAESMTQWGGSSAYFNGDAVTVTLHVAPGDEHIYFGLKEIITESSASVESNVLLANAGMSDDWIPTVPCEEGTNDMPEDTRVFSQDPAVGRIHHQDKWGRETGFLISNGAVLTTGHGIGLNKANTVIIQFNTPEAAPDGSTVHAHANDQYPVDTTRLAFKAASLGNDWAVVGLFPNSNTGLTAAAAQGAYYRLAKDVSLSPSDTLRITGYGADATPSGPGFKNRDGVCPNSGHKAQQTAVGNKEFESTHWWRIHMSASGGVSGSPLIPEDMPGLSIGIQTHGFNLLYGEYLYEKSSIQRFSRPELIESIHNFAGSDVFYADAGYPSTYGKGSQGRFFNPYDSVKEAVTAASSGGIVSIVEGDYPGNFTIEVDEGILILEAPVGTVTIGGPDSSFAESR